MDLFLSAVLGGLAGYVASRWQTRGEAKERRAVLVNFVWNELARLQQNLPPYDPDKAYSMDHVTSVGVDRLLDGETLTFRKDAQLLAALLNFRVGTTKYNSLIQATNFAMAGAPLADNVHKGMYDALSRHRRELAAARDSVLLLLPPRTEFDTMLAPELDHLAQICRQLRDRGRSIAVSYQGKELAGRWVFSVDGREVAAGSSIDLLTADVKRWLTEE